MIGALARAVAADLHERKFPHRVTYGPERAARDGFQLAIVFQRDRKAGDGIEPPIGAKHKNPEVPFMRYVGGQFTVYARSARHGAAVEDHEDECDLVCDGVLCALYRILAIKCLPLRVLESRMLDRDELTAELGGDNHSGPRSADWPGCAARVRFAVGTAVRDVTYKGEAGPTGLIAAVAIPTITSDTYPEFDPSLPPEPEPTP